jgi:hypothetical protein
MRPGCIGSSVRGRSFAKRAAVVGAAAGDLAGPAAAMVRLRESISYGYRELWSSDKEKDVI